MKKLGGNAGKRALPKNEPAPPIDNDLCRPPAWLEKDEIAAAEWRRIAPHLITLRILTVADRTALEAYCKAYSRWRQAEAIVEKNANMSFETATGYEQQIPQVAIALRYLSQMHSIAAEFGFTPASRARVTGAGGDGDGDDYEKFVRSRKSAPTAAPEAHASSRSLH